MKIPAALSLAIVSCSLTCCANADLAQPHVVLGPHAKHLEVGPGMDASGVRLEGSEFVGQDLSGAVFDGCDLYGVRFYQCELSEASFKRAHLSGMRIDDCNFEDADFTDAVINGALGSPPGRYRPRHDMVLSKSQLVSTRSYKTRNLDRCVLRGYQGLDFRGFNIRGSRLEGGDFGGCDFTDARIGESFFFGCTIGFDQIASTHNFKRQILVDVGFGSVRFRGECDFSGLNLAGAAFGRIKTPAGRPIPDLEFANAEVVSCSFSNSPDVQYITAAHLYETQSYKQKSLRRVTLAHFDLTNAKLSEIDLTGARFRSCRLEGADLSNAIITDTQFQACTGLTADQIRSTWNYKNGRMEGTELPADLAAALSDEATE